MWSLIAPGVFYFSRLFPIILSVVFLIGVVETFSRTVTSVDAPLTQAASWSLLLHYVNGIVRYFREQQQNTVHRTVIIHRMTAKRSRFRSFEPAYRFIHHLSSRWETSLSIFSARRRDFFDSPIVRQRFSSRPRSEIGRKIARGRRGREEERMGGLVCTLMRSVTCGIDVPRKRMKRSVKAEPK